MENEENYLDEDTDSFTEDEGRSVTALDPSR